MSLMLTCCPECGTTAEVADEGFVDGTHGPVRVVRVTCARRHWFLLDEDALHRGGGVPAPTSAEAGQ